MVETIGGATIALDYTRRALSAGKSVVTSNKELVATHGYELLQLAKQHNVSYLFEASVGGGIPIIRPINQCLAANELTEIAGILNGTTNYILTRMIRAGLSFEAALKEAQEKGYAERDPSADIEGADACRKICILSALAFGRHIYPDQVPTEGITHITLADVAFARSAGMKIKLLGRAIRREDAVGDVMFYGRGAGKLPTASAVVADVIDAAKHLKSRKYITWEDGGPDAVYSIDEVKNRWYVRVNAGSALPRGATPLANTCGADCEAFLTEAPLSERELRASLPDGVIQAAYRVLD